MNETYENIVSSAIKLMMKNGYSGTSIQMIAEEVSVSKSTVLHYFKNKEGILFEILKDFLPAAIGQFTPELENRQMNGFEKLNKFIKFHIRLLLKSGDVLALNINEAKYLSDDSKLVLQKHQKDYEKMLLQIIQQIKDENEQVYKNMNPKILSKAIMGMCNSPMGWFSRDGSISVDEISEQLFELVACDG